MPKIDIEKTSIFSVLQAVSKMLGGHYVEGIGEALMKIDNENAVGAIGACDLIGGISCLSYNITFHNEVSYHVTQREERCLYLVYMLNGYFHYKISDSKKFTKVAAHQNMIVEVDPQHTTIIELPKEIPLKHLVINVDNSHNNPHFKNQIATLSEELASVFSTTKRNTFYEYSGFYNLDILRAINELYDIEQDGAIGRILKEGVVRKILGFQLAEHERSIKEPSSNGLAQEDLENLLRTVQYIEDNLGKKHAVSALAKRARMSEKQLQQAFKRLFQKSTSEFIVELRLEKSRELLLEANMNISEIAYDLGFSNASYYASLFKKKFERTPKVYQKEFGGNKK